MKNSISILSVLIALAIVPTTGCAAVSKNKPSPVSKPKPKPGTVLWEFATDNGVAIRSSPSIGDDGTIYVGARDAVLYAVDSKTGEKKWSSKLGSRFDQSSLVLGTDGLIFTCIFDGRVCAVEAKSGEKKWEFRAGRMQYSPAIGPDGTIYFGTEDKHVYAIDPKTGKERWSYLTKNEVWFTPVVDAKGVVYVGSTDGYFYALDGKTGELIWRYSGEKIRSYSTASSAIGANGIIYTTAAYSIDVDHKWGRVLALDSKDGSKKWEFKLPGRGYLSPTIGMDGTIYMGSGDHSLIALDGQSGKQKWELKIGEYLWANVPAIGDDGTVYFGTHSRNIFAVDSKTHKTKWKVRTGDKIQSSPVIGDDGTLYIGSNDGRLYAIATSSTGPAKSPWPMFGQNAQRTSRAPAAK